MQCLSLRTKALRWPQAGISFSRSIFQPYNVARRPPGSRAVWSRCARQSAALAWSRRLPAAFGAGVTRRERPSRWLRCRDSACCRLPADVETQTTGRPACRSVVQAGRWSQALDRALACHHQLDQRRGIRLQHAFLHSAPRPERRHRNVGLSGIRPSQVEPDRFRVRPLPLDTDRLRAGLQVDGLPTDATRSPVPAGIPHELDEPISARYRSIRGVARRVQRREASRWSRVNAPLGRAVPEDQKW